MPFVLPVHVAAACVGLVGGFVALSARKGAAAHRASGRVFVGAMTIMCATGVIAGALKGQVMNVIVALLTAYMVITAFATMRPPAGRRRLDVGLLIGVAALAAVTLGFGVQALAAPGGSVHGYPAFAFFMFGAVALLCGAGDLRMIRMGGLRGRPRLVRHLWRMCWALWLATVSFVSSRKRVAMLLPDPLVIPAVRILPMLIVVGALLYWLWRVRSGRPIGRAAA